MNCWTLNIPLRGRQQPESYIKLWCGINSWVGISLHWKEMEVTTINIARFTSGSEPSGRVRKGRCWGPWVPSGVSNLRVGFYVSSSKTVFNVYTGRPGGRRTPRSEPSELFTEWDTRACSSYPFRPSSIVYRADCWINQSVGEENLVAVWQILRKR